MQESVWGEVPSRREGRRRAAAGPGLCAEGGGGRDGGQPRARLTVSVLWCRAAAESQERFFTNVSEECETI